MYHLLNQEAQRREYIYIFSFFQMAFRYLQDLKGLDFPQLTTNE